MANIFDYLNWRGDISFSTDPFNEVDNLILAELAYTQFDGIVPGDGTAVSLEEVRDTYFACNSMKDILRNTNPIAKAPNVLFQRYKVCRGTSSSNCLELRASCYRAAERQHSLPFPSTSDQLKISDNNYFRNLLFQAITFE